MWKKGLEYQTIKYSGKKRWKKSRWRKRRLNNINIFLAIIIVPIIIFGIIFLVYNVSTADEKKGLLSENPLDDLQGKKDLPKEKPDIEPKEPIKEIPDTKDTPIEEEDPIKEDPETEGVPDDEEIREEVPLVLVEKTDPVELSYFDDAVFIGNSRTEGLMLFTGFSNPATYSHKGVMVNTLFTEPAIKIGGEKLTIMAALEKTEFSKVYIMLGINETGWVYGKTFIEKYNLVIDEIKRINPDATIYVQSIIPVSKKLSSSHSYLKNEKIQEYNGLIQEMAQQQGIYYLNPAEAVVDLEGNLPENASVDGIHLKKDYCHKWLDYLKTHTVKTNN